MANRVLKDSIWTSPSLAQLPIYYQDQWPRWLLLADDWGCFNSDSEVIKGLAYPKRRETKHNITAIKKVFNETGMLFLWENGDGHTWGYFVNWEKHQFCNASTVDNAGKYTKHRRKTPEPPISLLNEYLQQFKESSDKILQVTTKSLNPIPIPIPNPNHNPIISPQVQTTDLLMQFSQNLQNKIKVYMERVALKNKSKVITDGRQLTLLTELWNSKERCADDTLFAYAVDMAISYDACCIGYVNKVWANKKAGKP